MPKLPASVADVLIVGVGDPRQGSFIDGRMSRQDTSTLRQIAARLGGVYHDGNSKQISTATLNAMTVIPRKTAFEKLSRREYALLACGIGASLLALLPVLLHQFGTRWRPGVPRSQAMQEPVGARGRTSMTVRARRQGRLSGDPAGCRPVRRNSKKMNDSVSTARPDQLSYTRLSETDVGRTDAAA